MPIARALADRGHEVAVFNPSPAPAALIAEAGLRNLPMPPRPLPAPPFDLAQTSRAWDVEEMLLRIEAKANQGERSIHRSIDHGSPQKPILSQLPVPDWLQANKNARILLMGCVADRGHKQTRPVSRRINRPEGV